MAANIKGGRREVGNTAFMMILAKANRREKQQRDNPYALKHANTSTATILGKNGKVHCHGDEKNVEKNKKVFMGKWEEIE